MAQSGCAKQGNPFDTAEPFDSTDVAVSPEAQIIDEGGLTVAVTPGSVAVGLWSADAGETPVGIRRHEVFGPEATADALHMLNLHDDESTSVDAALAVLPEIGGWVVELTHTGDRNLEFVVDGRSYTADPNRIFTPAGRQRTLASLSSATPQAFEALEAFSASVLNAYTRLDPPVVITLHNNTENSYSAASYASGGEYESDAEAVMIHEGSDPDDFFFVTDRPIYDALVARGFNAVLQDNARATDDGSLSVWASQNDRPYVNVEAQHGHQAEQERMIRALAEVLQGLRAEG